MSGGGEGRGEGVAYSFVACLTRLTIGHEPHWKWSGWGWRNAHEKEKHRLLVRWKLWPGKVSRALAITRRRPGLTIHSQYVAACSFHLGVASRAEEADSSKDRPGPFVFAARAVGLSIDKPKVGTEGR